MTLGAKHSYTDVTKDGIKSQEPKGTILSSLPRPDSWTTT